MFKKCEGWKVLFQIMSSLRIILIKIINKNSYTVYSQKNGSKIPKKQIAKYLCNLQLKASHCRAFLIFCKNKKDQRS